MKSKKYLRKVIAAMFALGSLNVFVPNVYHLPVVSVAHAEIKTCTGTGEYIGSMKETPEFAINTAKLYAERNAIEEAGIYIHSHSKAVNERLTVDEVVTFAGGIVSISKPDFESIMLTGEAKGYIKYRVTVVAKVDTSTIEDALNKWQSRDAQKNSILTEQNKELQKQVAEQQKRIVELEKQLTNAKTEQQKQQLNESFKELDKDALYTQKLEEGDKLFEKHKYSSAIIIYNEAIKLKSNDAKVYLYRGNAYLLLHEFPNAIEDYTKAVELNSKYAEAYSMRGFLYQDLGDNNRALDDYTKAIESDPESKHSYFYYQDRGDLYNKLGDKELAVEDFTKVLELNPQYGSVYYKRGLIYKKLEE